MASTQRPNHLSTSLRDGVTRSDDETHLKWTILLPGALNFTHSTFSKTFSLCHCNSKLGLKKTARFAPPLSNHRRIYGSYKRLYIFVYFLVVIRISYIFVYLKYWKFVFVYTTEMVVYFRIWSYMTELSWKDTEICWKMLKNAEKCWKYMKKYEKIRINTK
jgi:hypothetical protein